MFDLLKSKLGFSIRKFLNNKVVWRFIRPLAELFAELYQNEQEEKTLIKYEKFKTRYLYLLTNGVRRGPFVGLKYPFLSAIYSAFFPKVLGYYEMELHSAIAILKQNQYSSIHDVGCAEGYYAVGFAKMFPDSKLVAYDLDPLARERTIEMALANDVPVGDMFEIKDFCSSEELLRLDSAKKHLIFSDCEGFEGELFTNEVVSHLVLSDFVIEVHDFVSPGLCDALVLKFSLTHHVEIIKSIDDLYRYRFIDDQELLKLDLKDQIQLLAEKRPSQMEWLFCTSLT